MGSGRDRGRGGGRDGGKGGGGSGGGGGGADGVTETPRWQEAVGAAARKTCEKDELRKAEEDAAERRRETLAFMARWVRVGRP